jgi:hypothetical protein
VLSLLSLPCTVAAAACLQLRPARPERAPRRAAPPQVLANAVGAATAMGRGAGRNVARPGLVMDLLARHRRQGKR